jgi:hypothetical protein
LGCLLREQGIGHGFHRGFFVALEEYFMFRTTGLFLCVSALTALCLSPARLAHSEPTPASSALRRDIPAPRLLNRRALLSRHAMSFRGARYRFGAANARVTDCSGLTMQLYRSVGIKLPHSSRAQYHYGKPVKGTDLLPGDLLFFSTHGGGISHVGMYIGNGKMIHAANPRKGVRIDLLSSRYYAKRLVGARRLLPEGAAIPETPSDVQMGNGEPPVDEAQPETDPSIGTAKVADDTEVQTVALH